MIQRCQKPPGKNDITRTTWTSLRGWEVPLLTCIMDRFTTWQFHLLVIWSKFPKEQKGFINQELTVVVTLMKTAWWWDFTCYWNENDSVCFALLWNPSHALRKNRKRKLSYTFHLKGQTGGKFDPHRFLTWKYTEERSH